MAKSQSINNLLDRYQTVTKYYKENNVKFFSFNNPTDRKLSVVIRGVPYDYTDQEIYDCDDDNYLIPTCRMFNRLRQPTRLISVILEDNDAGRNF